MRFSVFFYSFSFFKIFFTLIRNAVDILYFDALIGRAAHHKNDYV